MSVNLYDKALSDKIRSWVLDPKMTILYPDETLRFFQQTADKNKDKINLPLISISRDRNIDIQLKNRRYGQQFGKTFNSNNIKSDHLRFIPITIRYQIDIYTRYREEADEYCRNFIFNIIDYPTLEIEIPYLNSGLKQKSFMELEETIQDNSDIPERLAPGQFTRMTLYITLKDANLYAYDVATIPKIKAISIRGDLIDKEDSLNNNQHYANDNCDILVEEFNINNK